MTTVPFHSKKSAMAVVSALRSDEHAPLSAMIEVADRCNEVCVHCYQVQGEKGELETDDWRAIMDELADIGVVFLTISGGEATLRKDFLDLVAHARKLRFAVKLYTNGLTMTRELAARLAELAVQEVQISLYSHRAEVHDWVTRVPGAFDKTVAGARFLMEAGVRVLLKTPLMSFNVDEVDEYIAFVTELGADYSVDAHLDPREDGDRSTESFRIADDEYLKIRRDPRFGRVQEERHTRELDSSVCGACSGNVHVEANGEIRPCTMLGVAVGHAVSDGIRASLAQNETGQSIRQVTWGDLHGCRVCDLRDFCGRCFANARSETGDALGPYRSACHKAQLHYELTMEQKPIIEPAPELGRDGSIGPYRELSPGRFRCIGDALDDDDRALQAKAWVRGASRPEPQARALPGQLVQIRRPGAKKAREEMVPSGSRASRSIIARAPGGVND